MAPQALPAGTAGLLSGALNFRYFAQHKSNAAWASAELDYKQSNLTRRRDWPTSIQIALLWRELMRELWPLNARREPERTMVVRSLSSNSLANSDVRLLNERVDASEKIECWKRAIVSVAI